MKSSIIILLFFAAGVLAGFADFIPSILTENDYSQWALYLLMFLVGISIGADTASLKAIRSFNLKILLVPVFTILGTTLGTIILWFFVTDYSFQDLLSVGYGFGYYSLSSIFITEIRGEELGVVALLSNVMREIITLLLAPLFAIYLGKIAPICSGGATSMDTTLPIISKSSGNEYAIISLFHGIILTILVPFLVTLVLSGL
ncbi:MAG TPA: lysine exporter LysO family protein [Tenuifilaceae bacterium]|nr:lysine exporter LysO family protein [Tenuifilaceae bacterium]HPE18654.1 lysine exporter LysO family protein [Tenuifilaceae bacterium]HPJ45563.1 lysine exporter LysO family protein [Tenuifilaceae bacterium]HPQ33669.1 lysine exporter LysO family protein [Tenuifilaceae bacterium]HRX68014.1 lysine exporter LysO family protein [Tenuifilaceae bacterium]